MRREPTILLTGAAGFIGSNLLPALHTAGLRVRAVIRSNQPPPCAEIVAKRLESDELDSALGGIESVIHLAGHAHRLRRTEQADWGAFERGNVDATKRLTEAAARAGVKRFVFLSTIGVYGRTTESGCPVGLVTPTAPISPYARSKLLAEAAIERICADSGMTYVILRPPLVYGFGAPGNFSRLARWIDSGIPIPFEGLDNRRSMLGVQNLCDLIIHALTANSSNVTSPVSDVTISTPQLVRLMADVMGRPPRLLPAPHGMICRILRAVGRTELADSLYGSFEIDPGVAADLLGWTAARTMDQQLLDTYAQWIRSTIR